MGLIDLSFPPVSVLVFVLVSVPAPVSVPVHVDRDGDCGRDGDGSASATVSMTLIETAKETGSCRASTRSSRWITARGWLGGRREKRKNGNGAQIHAPLWKLLS
jgi:hypothetical protein